MDVWASMRAVTRFGRIAALVALVASACSPGSLPTASPGGSSSSSGPTDTPATTAGTTPSPTPAPTPTARNGSFTALASSPQVRDDQEAIAPAFTATLLLDGRVLFAGGYSYSNGSYNALDTAELFDPTTNRFSPTGSLNVSRTGQTATRLADGRVLVAGGAAELDWGMLASAEIYDPATGRFTSTGELGTARENQTATLLRDGRVLIVGGDTGYFRGLYTAVGTAELYDPATGSFIQTGRPHFARARATATLLQDGRVLIVGGDDPNGNSIGPAELYDPATGRFTLTGSLDFSREGHTATLLPDGKVLILGGAQDRATGLADAPVDAGVPITRAEVYDPAIGRFTVAGSTPTWLMRHTATLLVGGRVLIAGGNGTSALLYDPTTAIFTATGQLTRPMSLCTATVLLDGRVLIVGGYISAADQNGTGGLAELYYP
jgi:hypothetical protein